MKAMKGVHFRKRQGDSLKNNALFGYVADNRASRRAKAKEGRKHGKKTV